MLILGETAHMSIVLKCMTIISIIITEEDLCQKHDKKLAKICQFSSLPSKCVPAVNDPNTKNYSKPHIHAYNYNTHTGFRVHKKTWGPRVLSSALLQGGMWQWRPLSLIESRPHKSIRFSVTCVHVWVVRCGAVALSGWPVVIINKKTPRPGSWWYPARVSIIIFSKQRTPRGKNSMWCTFSWAAAELSQSVIA